MKKAQLYFLILFTVCLLISACQSARQNETSAGAPQNAAQETKPAASSEQAVSVKTSESSPKPESDAKNEKVSAKTGSDNEIENRCGWYSNPTPANMWLNDKDGEWTIAVQGGYQAEGMDNIPDFGDEWVETNGSYGYGCTCLRVKVDRKEKQILEIISGTAKKIADCKKDKALKKP